MIRTLKFYLPVFLISIFFTIISIIVIKGGYVNPELYDRIPHLLSGKTVLARVFDPMAMDYNLYQARELSYLADQVDVAVIFEMIQRGVPNMISVIHYLFGTLAVLILYSFCKEDLKLGTENSLLMVILTWSAPCMMFGGSYTRSAKIGAATTLVAIFVLTYRLLKCVRFGERPKVSQHFLLGGLTFVMTLWDRQGFFMAIALFVFLMIIGILSREPRILWLLIAVLAALAASMTYNLILGPIIIHSLNGYWPDFNYQRLPWKDIMSEYSAFILEGTGMLHRAIFYNLGNMMSWVILIIFIVPLVMTSKRAISRKCEFRESLYPISVIIGLFISAVILPIAMNALMRARHTGVNIPVFQFYYYPLVTTYLWICLLAVGLSRVNNLGKYGNYLSQILCLLLIIGNLQAYQINRDIYYNGYLKHFIDPTAIYFKDLREVYEAKAPSDEALYHDPLFRLFARRMHHELPNVDSEKRFIPY
jgi:hypothetical protein